MWTIEKPVRLSGVYHAWIVRSILKNSFSGCSEVAGALGGKNSETMCEGKRVTGTARRDFCDWQLLGGRWGWACWRWTAPDQCSRSGKERKAEGEWRRRVKTLSNRCKKDSAFAQETGSFALPPLPAVLLRVPNCFSPFLRVYTGSWEPHLLKRLPFPPLSPLSTLTRSTFRHDWLLQDLDTLHPHQHPICN